MNKVAMYFCGLLTGLIALLVLQSAHQWYFHMRTIRYGVPPPNMFRHELFVHQAKSYKGGNALVLLGDSIFDAWRDEPESLQRAFGDRNVLNFAIASSSIAHVTWQVEHGLLDDLGSADVVLLVGTNDIRLGMSAEDIASRYKGLLDSIFQHCPHCHVMVVSLLPQLDNEQSVRRVNNALHELVSKMPSVQWSNVYDWFVPVSDTWQSDGIHPSWQGYQRLAQALHVHNDQGVALK